MAPNDTLLVNDHIDQPGLKTIPLWVIYDHPRDMPEYFVARKWLTDQPTEVVLTADSLDALRDLLPHGLNPIPRHANDDPNIVEVWL